MKPLTAEWVMKLPAACGGVSGGVVNLTAPRDGEFNLLR